MKGYFGFFLNFLKLMSSPCGQFKVFKLPEVRENGLLLLLTLCLVIFAFTLFITIYADIVEYLDLDYIIINFF